MGLMISTSLKAQKVSLSDLATLELPAKTQKISSKDDIAFAKSKGITIQGSPDSENKAVYFIDDIIFTFRIAKSKNNVDLAQLKKVTMDPHEGEFSGIIYKNYNYVGSKFLAMMGPNVGRIIVFGTNNKADISIRIVLEFKVKDFAKANTVLEEVLKGIRLNQ